MREGMGKYRGKDLKTGEWVYGFHTRDTINYKLSDVIEELKSDDNQGFWTKIAYEVDPATVGQETGKSNLHGQGIYEGDNIGDDFGNAIVFWSDKYSDWRVVSDAGEHTLFNYLVEIDCEVIGTIHDKPELVK